MGLTFLEAVGALRASQQRLVSAGSRLRLRLLLDRGFIGVDAHHAITSSIELVK